MTQCIIVGPGVKGVRRQGQAGGRGPPDPAFKGAHRAFQHAWRPAGLAAVRAERAPAARPVAADRLAALQAVRRRLLRPGIELTLRTR